MFSVSLLVDDTLALQCNQLNVANYNVSACFTDNSRNPISFNSSVSVNGIRLTFNSTITRINDNLTSGISVNGSLLLIEFYAIPPQGETLLIHVFFKNGNGTVLIRTYPPKANVTSFLQKLYNTTTASSHQGSRFNPEYLVLLFIIPLIVYVLLTYVNKRK